jgi:hypothetical protein
LRERRRLLVEEEEEEEEVVLDADDDATGRDVVRVVVAVEVDLAEDEGRRFRLPMLEQPGTGEER